MSTFEKELALRLEVNRELQAPLEYEELARHHRAATDILGYEEKRIEENQEYLARRAAVGEYFTKVRDITSLILRPEDINSPYATRVIQAHTLFSGDHATYPEFRGAKSFETVIGEAPTENPAQVSLLTAAHTDWQHQGNLFWLRSYTVDKASWQSVRAQQEAKLDEPYDEGAIRTMFQPRTGIYLPHASSDRIHIKWVKQDWKWTLGKIATRLRPTPDSSNPAVVVHSQDIYIPDGSHVHPESMLQMETYMREYEIPAHLARIISHLGMEAKVQEFLASHYPDGTPAEKETTDSSANDQVST